MKPLIVIDDDRLSFAEQSVIMLRHSLGFGAACELASEWASFQHAYDRPPADMHAAYLLLTHYIIDWRGPAFAAVGPYSLHALSQVDPYLPIMIAACTRVIEHHARTLPPIEQPDGLPADDPEYEAMVERWRQKLSAKDSRAIAAGRHDSLVSLIWALKMTQRQIETEFEPAVLAELLARLDAEARNQDETAKGKKKKGPRPAKPMTREQKIAQMAEWNLIATREVA